MPLLSVGALQTCLRLSPDLKKKWSFCLYFVSSSNIEFNFYCRLSVVLPLAITFWRFAKVAIFSTGLHSKHQTSNLRKTVIRSTAPPLLQNPCYQLAFCLSCKSGPIGVSLSLSSECFCFYMSAEGWRV